jgi:hypothetical protein
MVEMMPAVYIVEAYGRRGENGFILGSKMLRSVESIYKDRLPTLRAVAQTMKNLIAWRICEVPIKVNWEINVRCRWWRMMA